MLPRPRSVVALALLLAACGPINGPDLDGTASAEAGDTEPLEPTTGDHSLPDSCNPANLQPGMCPSEYSCCSDDPATTQGRIPNYFQSGQTDDKYGVPIFSANNNILSHSGQCVAVGGFASPFANGCPVPCNPTWDAATKLEICGASATCCQFVEVDPMLDCVMDPMTGKWRAVTGEDIPTLTTWGGQHTTNQDPVGESCAVFASGGGSLDQDVYDDCVAQLSVADQRGFCYAADECPCKEDLCDQKNPGWVPRCP